MEENDRYKRGSSYGRLKEQAKMDGFESIRDWQNWKRENVNRQIRKHEFEQSWTEEKILEHFRQFYEKTGRVPIASDFDNDPRCPSIYMVLKICGSWNNAIMDSGLWNMYYNGSHACDRCGESFDDIGWGHPLKEYDGKGEWTGNWDCTNCYQKYDPNSMMNVKKSIADSRTGNLSPSSSSGKGGKGEELLCIWKGFVNLNKENDNYNSPIDCKDLVMESYHQVKIAYYNSVNKRWSQNFNNIQYLSIKGFGFKSLFLFCVSEDGKKIERVSEISEEDIIVRLGITVAKNSCPSRVAWYDQYRLEDKGELKKLNEIWQKML